MHPTDCDLVNYYTYYEGDQNKGNYYIQLYRDPMYIASIWKPDSAYVKTAEKFMRVDYKVTFENEEEGTNS